MKKFEIPMVEIVYFDKKDVITTSSCDCVECPICPEGDHCPSVDNL